MTATTERLRGTRVPARVRIMAWLVGLMTLCLATVVLVIAERLGSGVDDRANRAIEQEVGEFVTFAQRAKDPATGLRIDDPGQLLQAHLAMQYPDADEVHLGVVVTDRLHAVQQGEPPYEVLDDRRLLRDLVAAPGTYGEHVTPAGAFRWAKITAVTQDGARGWFVTGYFMAGPHAETQETVTVLVLVSAVGLVVAVAVAWLVAGAILAPVRTVRQAAARITEEDLTQRISMHGRDDIAALAEQFNAMLDRLEQAFTAQREFIDDASHELRTPITIVRGHLEVMGDDPAERAEVVRLCTDELDRMSRIVEDLLLLARAQRPDFLRPRRVPVADLTVDIDAKVRALGDRTWQLESVAEGDAWLDPQRVTQAVVQLAQNAVQHTTPGDEIRLGSSLRGGSVSLWITDVGSGIAPDELSRIFDRFARGAGGRVDQGGAGLGLAIVKAIAEAHRGVVHVMSEPGRGTTVGVELPSIVEEVG
ncbi:sensor histidine kinase [Actinophytocola algeriensis]|uniref:histidine kinase n=1 Tax=Actinophytocola algeriensis TaxID=1768010 RepID=A0A7W7VHU0_9PSEU|nr:ATP-binding protein [Actinophytocola algeriensis]MBB4910857.1 signal transduction histidine kinase [Actinophytocola algeriensis]MBE1473850.1 signal transduction histidine kinase [Actinophytocola algeriensis]